MIVRVLGSAAGGGFPQANCNCSNCRAVRTGADALTPRLQTCVAVSQNGSEWMLLGASPDLRQQIAAAPFLHPNPEAGPRSSPIQAVLLTCGEVDCTAGLLSLREGFTFDLLAPRRVLEELAFNSVFNVLSADCVQRVPLLAGQTYRSAGLDAEVFPVAGKAPNHATSGNAACHDDTVGARISDAVTRASFFHIPGCAAVDEPLARLLKHARLVLFDGTLYRDDEMIAQGLSHKTGRSMGHMSMSGSEGTLSALANLDIQRRVFVHINNSNPALDARSKERAEVEQAGWEIAFDGMEIRL